jgi:penicillin-binding protein 1C
LGNLVVRLLIVLAYLFTAFYLVLGLVPDPLEKGGDYDWTLRLLDRNGLVLREFLSPALARRDQMSLSSFSPHLVEAIIAAEDKRFYSHMGIDFIAVSRAFVSNLKAGKIVSGGSTITMQLARLSMGLSPGPRTFSRKFKEVLLALIIERQHTKKEILEAYLNSVPTGKLTVGFEAASKAYLGKSAIDLSPAEAAFLAALPAAPSTYNPWRNRERTLSRRNWILGRMGQLGSLSEDGLKRALLEPLVLTDLTAPYLAPHFSTHTRGLFPEFKPQVIYSTLDLRLQLEVEELAKKTVEKFTDRGLEQVAVVVMTVKDREILAWVGSGDFFNPIDGQVDGVLSPRQPGSALKPFIYALAFSEGIIWPSARMSDSPIEFVGKGEVFSPINYSQTYSGNISARVALASSLNVPAVNLTYKLGTGKVLEMLHNLGFSTLDRDEGYYGLALSLGSGEVSLLDMTLAYAALADQGSLKGPRYFLEDKGALGPGSHENTTILDGKRVFSPEVTFLIKDILSDPAARFLGFGEGAILKTNYPSSVKTGTSTNFKDNWCIGFTDRYVVGVWAGNFANRPMFKVSGITGAGELWREVMDLLEEDYPYGLAPIVPPGVIELKVCPVTGLPAGPQCPNSMRDYFLSSLPLPPQCDHESLHNATLMVPFGSQEGFGLIRPQSGEIYALDPSVSPNYNRVISLVQLEEGTEEIIWVLNGEELSRSKVAGSLKESYSVPLVKGLNRLEIIAVLADGTRMQDSARYRVN